MKLTIRIASASLLLVALTSCARDDVAQITAGTSSVLPEPALHSIHADYAFPVESPTDWVTFGDIFASFTVVDIERQPVSKEEEGRSEGVLINKKVTVQLDTPPLWIRQGAAAPPKTFSFHALGWVLRDGREQPVVENNSLLLVEGEVYTGVFARWDVGGWGPISPATFGRLTAEGRVSLASRPSIDGKRPEEIAAELARTAPHVGAIDAENLDVVGRAKSVAAAGGPTGPAGGYEQ